jgi:hypothetical protein
MRRRASDIQCCESLTFSTAIVRTHFYVTKIIMLINFCLVRFEDFIAATSGSIFLSDLIYHFRAEIF